MSSIPEQARRVVGAMLVDGFFEGVSRFASLHPQARPHRHGVERITNLRYDETSRSRAHLLDIWRPSQAVTRHRVYEGPPWPIVFYVHGGGFRMLSKDTHWIMGLAFARRGFLVVNVSYRLAPKHPYPSAVEDVSNAFTWMASNAARFGGDLSRVVLAGESAGANLVTSLALALAYERDEPFAKRVYATDIQPRAVLPACGVFQVTDMDRLRRDKPHMTPFIADRLHELTDDYLGHGPWPVSLDFADPLLAFERAEKPARPLPPFFLPVGTKDPLLPDTKRLGAALRALGAVAEEKYYPGELHAFHAFVMRKAARECWRDTYAFLDRFVPR